MTVTVTASASHDSKLLGLVAKQAEVTALTSAAATAGFQQPDQQQRLRDNQRLLVSGCLDAGRLDPGAVITACSVPTAGFPRIAILTALIVSNPLAATAQASELRSEQIRCIEAWMDGGNGAATILSTMS